MPLEKLDVQRFIDDWPDQLGREVRGLLRQYKAGTLTDEQVQEKVRQSVEVALKTIDS